MKVNKMYPVLVVLIAAVFSFTAVSAQSIAMVGPIGGMVPLEVGTTFVVTIEVGNPTAVTNLVGVSFHLNWNDTDYVEASGSSSGDFWSGTPIFFPQSFDDHIELGIASTTGGQSGSGIVANCTLQVKQGASGADIPVEFTLSNIDALDGDGNTVTMNVENNPLTILLDDPNVAIDDETPASIPDDFVLLQNYPNPFNPSTHIRFGLPVTSDVNIQIFNVLGERVAVLLNGRKSAGFHELLFDASGLASGTYIYEIQAGDFKEVKKMLLMK